MLSKQKVVTLGFQHVLAMYAGAVIVPLIVGGALKLNGTQMAYLIAADLFTCGIATILQVMGTKYFGSRLPVILGCTFTAVGPIIAIASASNLATAYGAIILSGLFVVLAAPLYGKMLRFFPYDCDRLRGNDYRAFLNSGGDEQCGRRPGKRRFRPAASFAACARHASRYFNR